MLAHIRSFGRNPRGSPDFLAYPVPKACMHVLGTRVPRHLSVARSAWSPKAAQALGCSLTVSGSRLAGSPAWHGLPQCPGCGHQVSYCCAAFVFGSGLRLGVVFVNPASPGWGLGWVCLGTVCGVVPLVPAVYGVRGWAYVSACLWTCGVSCALRLPPAVSGCRVRFGRACGARVSAVPRLSWLGSRGVFFALFFFLLSSVRCWVSLSRALWSLSPHPLSFGLGYWLFFLFWSHVSACLWTCVVSCALRLPPAFSGCGVRCGRACWARVSAVPRPSWLGSRGLVFLRFFFCFVVSVAGCPCPGPCGPCPPIPFLSGWAAGSFFSLFVCMFRCPFSRSTAVPGLVLPVLAGWSPCALLGVLSSVHSWGRVWPPLVVLAGGLVAVGCFCPPPLPPLLVLFGGGACLFLPLPSLGWRTHWPAFSVVSRAAVGGCVLFGRVPGPWVGWAMYTLGSAPLLAGLGPGSADWAAAPGVCVWLWVRGLGLFSSFPLCGAGFNLPGGPPLLLPGARWPRVWPAVPVCGVLVRRPLGCAVACFG